MLERWLSRLVRSHDTEGACLLHAHILFLFKNMRDADVNFTVASVVIAAHVWMTVHYRCACDGALCHQSMCTSKYLFVCC
jgi:hypothetical protein